MSITSESRKTPKKRRKGNEGISIPPVMEVGDEEDVAKILFSFENGGASCPISVEDYTFQLAVQEALLASIPRRGQTQIINLDGEGDQSSPMSVDTGEETLASFLKTPAKVKSFTHCYETGESSTSKVEVEADHQQTVCCPICVKEKHPFETFEIRRCSHIFCSDCIRGHVAARVGENISIVRCPDVSCEEVLDLESCRSILSPEVFDRWESILCESMIQGTKKFYCPFKDCSGLLVNERESAVITESECPHCRRLFCARCKVSWHSGLDCDEFQHPLETVASFLKTPAKVTSITHFDESGESSTSKAELEAEHQQSVYCRICMEEKHPLETFEIRRCSHVFCSDCIRGHVAARVGENISTVRCPDVSCEGVLDLESCGSILSPEVFDRWGSILCESLIQGSMKFYCPFKDCSGLLVDESEGHDLAVITESECPHCRRLFCARCKVSWHSGLDCDEFQKLKENERGEDDVQMARLAKTNKWQRCPQCGFYVERIDGCLYMKCRCKYSFCYHCAGPVGSSHYCPRCKR